MKYFGLLGVFATAFGIVACGDDGSSVSAEVTSSSSEEVLSSSSSQKLSSDNYSSSSEDRSSSSSDISAASSADTSYAAAPDTTRITYTLKRFNGPLANPHKGFTVPTEGTWVFVPEFEYGPYGSLNNRAWDLITYGSGYQKWSKLNPAKGVYDWTELDKLLEALAEHDMGYALRVLPYSPSFIRGNDTPEEEYDWTPPFVYEEGAKKITATVQWNGYRASVPVWDDSVYLHYAKEFAKAKEKNI